MNTASVKRTILFDVDNTLLDNDAVTEDLRHYLEKEVGPDGSRRYWDCFERLRGELGYADYLGALQRYRHENPKDMRLLTVSRYLIDYPFGQRIFPRALDAIEQAKRFGFVGILSDGDVVFQPRKIERSGLLNAVNGNVLIYVHKELELGDVEQRFPADHYVLIDDKLRILTAVKKIWGSRVTTIFVRQGHYALDEQIVKSHPAADKTLDRIGDLSDFGPEIFASGFGTGR